MSEFKPAFGTTNATLATMPTVYRSDLFTVYRNHHAVTAPSLQSYAAHLSMKLN